MISLFHADLFIEKNVGTPEQQKELKDFLLSISQNDNFRNKPLTNDGCIRFDFNVMKNSIDWLSEAKVKLTEKTINHYNLNDNKILVLVFDTIDINCSIYKNV